MPKNRKISLQTRISVLVAASILLVTVLIGGIYVGDQTRRIREFENKFLNDSLRSAATIAYTMTPALVENDFARMSELVSYYSKRSDRVYVAVVDAGGRIMADSSGRQIGSTLELPAPYVTENTKEGSIRSYANGGKEWTEISSPIKAGDLVLGSVRIGLSTDWLRKETDKIRRDVAVFFCVALAIVSLGIVAAAAIARRISRPILLLTEAAENIGRGDYEQLVDIRGGEVGVLANAFNKMARDLKDSRAELVEKEALQTSEARLKEAQQIAHLGHWEWDIATNSVDWSDELYRIYGYEPHEVSPDYGLVVGTMHPESREEFSRAIGAALEGKRTYEIDYSFFRKDGSEAVLHSIGRVLRDSDGTPLRMVGTVQDITAQRRAEEALRESEEKLRTFFQSANDAVFMLDLEGNFIDVNRAAHERLGYTREEMVSMNLSRLDPPEFAVRVPERISRVVTQGQAVFETAHMRKDGSVMPVEVNARTIELKGKRVIFSVIRDITERKAAEERIKSALAEKEVLLKEVHHRVKNNLQVVSSMLSLQSGYVKGEEAKALFEDSQRRVDAMSLIHEKLYRSGDMAKIDFGEYIDGLVCNLTALSAGESEQIEMKAEIEGVTLDVNNSIPCGLIISELVTNAIRHAFPGGRKGEIRIHMHRDGEGRIVLSVSDDGTGFPVDIDFRNTQSLGMQLVVSLVSQLGGTIELDRSRGTSFKIAFCT